MFEKVNPAHPDKIADRIAGAMVDLAYERQENPKVAVEVLIGHGRCVIVVESSYKFKDSEVKSIVDRIAPGNKVDLTVVAQDSRLAENQAGMIRCGDNGIFRGVPITDEELTLSRLAQHIYAAFPFDGKYILDGNKLTACQSHARDIELKKCINEEFKGKVRMNPLGEWSGGTLVDTGAVNRKLGSDLGNSVTGGGLHGKDLSKADVSVTIYAWLKAQETGEVVEMTCAIGDEKVNGVRFADIVERAREFVKDIGGFEKMAEWGLI